jgi:hypothetical protein
MTVSAVYNLGLEVSETYATSLDLATPATQAVAHAISGSTGTMNAASTVPATKVASDSIALTGGALTLDLTALVGAAGAAVTFLGLKVQLAKFKNPSTNTGTLVITAGAANGYNIFGDADGSVTLGIGAEVLMMCPDTLDAVAGADLGIDITSAADADATLQYLLVAG